MGGGVKVLSKKRKRTHGHRQQCGGCGGGWEVQAEEGIRRINGNGINTV